MTGEAGASPLASDAAANGAATPAAIVGGLRPCEFDACEGLTGRQKRFASKRCAQAWYDLHRPRILSPAAGAPRDGSIKAAVLACLVDGRWWGYHELAAACKADKHSIVSRVSELHRAGHRIEFDLPRGNSRRGHRVRLLTGAAA
jgi:hypothetical protein